MHGFEHPGIVRRVARKVGARQTVEFAPAGAKVRDHAAPAALGGLVHERERVVAVRTPLEAVKVHEHRGLGIQGFGLGPVPDHEVPVGKFHVFDAVLHFGTLRKLGGQTGLQMRARAPGRRPVVGRNDGHEGSLERKVFFDSILSARKTRAKVRARPRPHQRRAQDRHEPPGLRRRSVEFHAAERDSGDRPSPPLR